MSLSFLLDDMNADFLDELSHRWTAVFDDDRYTLIDPSVEALLKQKSIAAVDEFFADFGSHFLQDEVDNESRTAHNAYTTLFEGTGYTPILVDGFSANTLSYQKNESKAARFHYFNKRYKAEFEIKGKYIYLYHKIGSKKPYVRIDENLNADSARVSESTSGFWNWCKCYFDKDENTEGGDEVYKQEYVYQNTDSIAKYGEVEGPAIYQGSIKSLSVMENFAQDSQEKSWTVSHEVSLVDLQRQGYDEFVFNVGDTVRLSLPSIGQTIDIRIIEMEEIFDIYGNRTGLTLTLGNQSAVKASKRARKNAMLNLEDWLEGRKPIPMDILTPALQRASEIINGDSDSVMDYRKDRLIGWHSKNEGNNVQLNVSGLEIVRNGVPKTAVTYEGIVAEMIMAGTMIGMTLIGGKLASLNDNTEWNLNTGEFRMGNADMTLYGGAKIIFTDSFNQILFKSRKSGESFDRVSGFGVGYGTSGYPFAHMGAHPSGTMQTTDILYTGFTAASSTAIAEGGSSSVTGKRFQFRSDTAFNKMITLDYFDDSLTWYGMNNFTVGSEPNPVDVMYLDGVYSRELKIFNPNPTSKFGFVHEITSSNGRPTFRARWASSTNHDLGRSNYRWNQIYLKNSPNVSSDERLKKNIVDNTLGLEFINRLKTKRYDLISNESDEKSQLGVIAQQLKPVLEEFDSDIALLEKGNDGYYGVKYEQFTPIILLGMQEHYTEFKLHKSETQKEIEFLKEENVKLKKRLSKLEGVA